MTHANEPVPLVPQLRAAISDGMPRISRLWVVGIIAAVVYGSLIPFEIDLASFSLTNGYGLLSIDWAGICHEDAITNVLVYVPIGLAVVWCAGRRRPPRSRRIPLAIAIGIAVSLLAETLQTGIAARVSSWADLAFNGLGATAGALLGVKGYRLMIPALQRARRGLANRPFAAAAAVLTFALLVYHLAPFDFVTSTAAVHESFLHARWNVTTARPTSFLDPPGKLLMAELSGAAWFALLAYIRAFAELQRGRRPVVALASAIKHAVVLVVLIEFMQLFTLSHTFDLAAMLLRSLGAVLGAWSAIFLVDQNTGSRWRQRPGYVLPTAVLATLVAFQAGLILGASLTPGGWAPPGLELAGSQWMPFVTLWHGSMLGAAGEVASIVLTYGVLTVTLGIILRRSRVAQAWLIAGTAVTLLAVTVEAIHGAGLSHAPDLTGPMLAAFAAAFAARTYVALRSTLLSAQAS